MFNSSKTSQSAEQQTSNATGFQSIASGRSSQISRNVFGDKNLAKNDFTKPALIVAGALVALAWIKGKAGK